jgi:hypothetical protein
LADALQKAMKKQKVTPAEMATSHGDEPADRVPVVRSRRAWCDAGHPRTRGGGPPGT